MWSLLLHKLVNWKNYEAVDVERISSVCASPRLQLESQNLRVSSLETKKPVNFFSLSFEIYLEEHVANFVLISHIQIESRMPQQNVHFSCSFTKSKYVKSSFPL